MGTNLILQNILFCSILEKIPKNVKHGYVCVIKYPVVICGLGVLVTGDDLGSHPVGSTDEGVPPTDRLIQLCRHPKVNWNIKDVGQFHISKQPQSLLLYEVFLRLSDLCMYVWLCDCSLALPGGMLEKPQCMCRCVIPSLTSAFSVSKTFCPLMSLWITWWEWRWERPWKTNTHTHKHIHTHRVRWPPAL